MVTSQQVRVVFSRLQTQSESELFSAKTFAFLLIHIPIAFLLNVSGVIGMLHAGLALLVGIQAALRQKTLFVLATMSYIAGAEILWRMTKATIFWEFAKYAIVLLAVIAIVSENRTKPRRLIVELPDSNRKYRKKRSFNPIPIFYLAFLFPSIIHTLAVYDLSATRSRVSFNLSGALVLAILLVYLWQQVIDRKGLETIMIALIAPIVGVLVRAIYFTLTRQVTFDLEANFVTSGGYGPNQVSSILGLGALACITLLLFASHRNYIKLFWGVLAVAFLFQALLTFSRGGVYSFLAATIMLGIFLLRQPQIRSRFIVVILLGLFTAIILIVPGLNRLTAEIWRDRFASLETTGRLQLAEADLQAFQDHPLTGVGVGLSNSYHVQAVGRSVATHTEFSRILAEHGSLGIISLILLLSLLLQALWRAKSQTGRALAIAFMVWGISVMLHSAMRFAAISYVLALGVLVWQLETVGATRGIDVTPNKNRLY